MDCDDNCGFEHDRLSNFGFEEDRLSFLPEKVIFHIFSFLGANYTARLCLVSKRFGELCMRSPYVHFSADFDLYRSLNKYEQFCKYVDKLLRSRQSQGIELHRFVIHCICKPPVYNICPDAVDAWVGLAGKCNLQELDVLCNLQERMVYFLFECVCKCPSLRVLRLNLQMGRLGLPPRELDSLEELSLDSVDIPFGRKISDLFRSLKKLTLRDVGGIIGTILLINISTLEELEISNRKAVYHFHDDWRLAISSPSLKVVTISGCRIPSSCLISLTSQFMENFSILGCKFEGRSVFKMDCQSLHNFEIYGSNFQHSCQVNIACPSIGHVRIRSCDFEGTFPNYTSLLIPFSCLISLTCQFLENLSILGCKFEGSSVFKMDCQSLHNFEICGSNFQHSCKVNIACLSIDHVRIRSCDFEWGCLLNTESTLLLADLSVFECDCMRTRKRVIISGLQQQRQEEEEEEVRAPHIALKAEKLRKLGISSSDKHTYEFPLTILAPELEEMAWKGDPVDFKYLEKFISLEKASIQIKPSCRHKTTESARHCMLAKSLIYPVGMLLQSLSRVESLRINLWPVEIFFFQDNEPLYFPYLEFLELNVEDSLAQKISIIATFLKGLPNLTSLIINCNQKSPLLGDPNLIGLLGLNMSNIVQSTGEDLRRVEITATDAWSTS